VLAYFIAVAAPLAVTVFIETSIAAILGLRGLSLGAVVAVNFVTNPILNLVMIFLSGFLVPMSWSWPVLGVLEGLVIVVEWRVLGWVLGSESTTSRKLMVVSFVMNAVSATLGTLLLVWVL
jgi:hypothetical protein